MTEHNEQRGPVSTKPRAIPAGMRIPRSPADMVMVAFRLLTAAGLAIDAYVHFDLASTYAENQATINEGVLFRIESVVAILAAVVVLLTGRWLALAFGFALLVSASALAVMLISRYVNIGAFGPFPDTYDPVWFTEKLVAAYGEGLAVVASLVGLVLRLLIRRGDERRSRRSRI